MGGEQAQRIYKDIMAAYSRKNGPSLPKDAFARQQTDRMAREISDVLASDELILYILNKNREHHMSSLDHMLRAGMSYNIVTLICPDDLKPVGRKTIEVVAFVHDAGKIYMPQELLAKPGRLTQHEFEIMKCHNMLSATLLRKLEPKYPGITEISLGHHNYPRTGNDRRACERRRIYFGIDFDRRECERRKCDRRRYDPSIEAAAKILMICDIFDALSSPRDYKEPWQRQDVRAELEKEFERYKSVVQKLYLMFPRN